MLKLVVYSDRAMYKYEHEGTTISPNFSYFAVALLVIIILPVYLLRFAESHTNRMMMTAAGELRSDLMSIPFPLVLPFEQSWGLWCDS